jgi:hypothetical protein
VTAGNATPNFGQADTFTATVAPVAPATGTPAGTVTFAVDGSTSAVVALASGQAQWTTSSLQQGAHTISAAYSGQAGTYQASTESTTVTVGCGTVYTGKIQGPVNVSSGSACINAARIAGAVTVSGGASVSIVNSWVEKGVSSSGASLFSLCGSTVGSTLTVNGTTGLVLVGSNADDPAMACAANTVGGGVTLTGNSGGVELGGNSIKGAVTFTNNVQSGPSVDAEDTAPEIENNSIRGSLTCTGNNPAPIDDGAPNKITGAHYGQCSAPNF